MATPESGKNLLESIQKLIDAAKVTEGTWETDRRDRIAEAVKELADETAKITQAGAIDWATVDQKDIDELLAQRERLQALLDVDGPMAPKYHIMRRAYAPTSVVVLLLIFGASGIIATLSQIVRHWSDATGDVNKCAGADPCGSGGAGGQGGQGGQAGRQSPDRGAADAGSQPAAAAPVAAAARHDGGAPAGPVSPDDMKKIILEAVAHANGREPIKEKDLLYMIVLMGMLGGFVHLTSSLSRYVGNRQLLRSWVVWYLLMPFSGAALAPTVYLLLRVGVLSNGTEHLNVFGLYGFAALTGLFAEQAIEMLANVFTQVFSPVKGKDPIDAGKKDRKGGQGS